MLYVLFYLLLLIITLILTCYKKNKHQTMKLLKYGGITSISFAAFIFLSVVFSFNTSFSTFHQIFFPQGNWVFPSNSLLIRTFPIEFFISISRNIFLLTFLLSSIFILVPLFIKEWFSSHVD